MLNKHLLLLHKTTNKEIYKLIAEGIDDLYGYVTNVNTGQHLAGNIEPEVFDDQTIRALYTDNMHNITEFRLSEGSYKSSIKITILDTGVSGIFSLSSSLSPPTLICDPQLFSWSKETKEFSLLIEYV